MANKTLKTKALTRKNKLADARVIAEAEQTLTELRRIGFGPAPYDLSSPYSRQTRAVRFDGLYALLATANQGE